MNAECHPMRCLVFDLGAGSGRAMLVEFSDGRLSVRPLNRFSGYEIRMDDGPAWAMDVIRAGIHEGLSKAAAVGTIASVAVDSWGVDFALLDEGGALIDTPRTYRHPRGAKGMSALAAYHGRIAERTGVQMLPIATVFHLSQWARDNPGKVPDIRHFVMVADLFTYELSGVVACEKTLSRTSGLLAIDGSDWDREVIDYCGLPEPIFGRLVDAGTILGPLCPELVSNGALATTKVIAAAGHDTAGAAFALAPAEGEAFAVCGSWNLLGADIPEGHLPQNAHREGFGVEGGIGGRGLLTRSLPGLFLVRRLRDSWKARTGEDIDFPTLGGMALAADPETSAVVPSAPFFFDPVDMVEAMHLFQPALKTAGIDALCRALYVGLAREAAACILQLGDLSGAPIHTIRVGGGGSRDAAWLRFLADESGCRIIAGPVEASVVGSALIQFVALGAIPSFAAARELVRNGADMETIAE